MHAFERDELLPAHVLPEAEEKALEEDELLPASPLAEAAMLAPEWCQH